MPQPKPPIVLTFVRDFPARENVIGGEQVRPLELFELLGRRGVDAEVWCIAPTAPRELGTLRVRRLPLPAWGPVRALLAIFVSLVILLWRSRRRRVVLYQRVAGGIGLKRGVPYIAEPGWLFFGIARLLGVVTWASMHDLSPEHEHNFLARAEKSGIDLPPSEQHRTRKLARINERVQKWALPRATVVSVVSESLRREVIQRYGVTNDQLFVIRAGFNTEMLAGVTPWSPPIDRKWIVAYVGSRYDLELGILLEATEGLPDVELLLAGRGMDEAATAVAHGCRIMDATYAKFPALASAVDVWVVPIANDPYLHWSWHLKLPMDLATGRPVVLSESAELKLSGLAQLFFIAEPSAAGIAAQLEGIMRDPASAHRKATEAKREALRSMRWEHSFSPVLERLGLTLGPASPRERDARGQY